MKKILWPLIFLSLGLNVFLAWRMATRQSPAVQSAPAVAAVEARPATDQSPGGLWASLQPEDQPTLVARLREAGFPPEVVRAIVLAQVQEEFGARRKALDPDAAKRPFWRRNIPDPKVMAAQRQLGREQEARVRALLGPDAESNDPLTQYYRSRQFGELPPEKMAQVQALQREFSEKQMELFSPTGTGVFVSTPATMEKMRALEREQRDALAKIFSPQELEAYDFRNSSAAMNVRSRISGLDLSEQEFRTLYQLQDAFDQRYDIRSASAPSPELMRERMDAQRQLNEQVKSVLGPARYEEYERASQPDYRNTSLLVARLELPPQTTQQIWAVRDNFMQRATAIRTNRNLPPEQRTQQLAALQHEAGQAIAPLVGGPRGFEAYQQYGGSWLQRINPPPPPAQPGMPGAPATPPAPGTGTYQFIPSPR